MAAKSTRDKTHAVLRTRHYYKASAGKMDSDYAMIITATLCPRPGAQAESENSEARSLVSPKDSDQSGWAGPSHGR